MAHTYSLSPLMALPLNPPQMVQLAADTGCAFTGLRLRPAAPGGVAYPLMDDPPLLRETLAVMAATGVQVLDLEMVRLNAGFDVQAVQRFLAVGAQLGARHVLVAGDDADEARLTANFAALCEAAAPYTLSCDLEFMPWTAVRGLADAKRIVAAVAQPNAGVLVDALHFNRSGSQLADLDNLPRAWLHYAQICDGRVPGPSTAEGQIFDARRERLLPGEGDIDLPALFNRLPSGLPIGIEVPSESRAPVLGYTAWAKRAKAMAQTVLGSAG